jgi:ribosomal protein S15P/S13E
MILRDSHAVAQVRFVTGNKILRILKSKGLAPDLPKDLYLLIKKAVAVRKHLERNRKDKDAKFLLILTESRIHRLARCSHQIGNMSRPQPLLRWHKCINAVVYTSNKITFSLKKTKDVRTAGCCWVVLKEPPSSLLQQAWSHRCPSPTHSSPTT